MPRNMDIESFIPTLSELGVYRFRQRDTWTVLWIRGSGASADVQDALSVETQHRLVDSYPAVIAREDDITVLEEQASNDEPTPKWVGLHRELQKKAKELNLKGYSSLRKRELQLALVARKHAERGQESGMYKPKRRTHQKEEAYWYEDRLGSLVSMPLPEPVANVTWMRKAKELDKTEVDSEFAAVSTEALAG